MSQQQQPEMSFAQALTEARQIIVQQSNRIKTDLDKIKSLQDTIASQTSAITAAERAIREQADAVARGEQQIQDLTARLAEATQAREQAETIIDRQGQRLTQSQAALTRLEQQVAEYAARLQHIEQELMATQSQLPTAQDNEALAALSNLLATKKVSVPAAPSGPVRPAVPPQLRMSEAA
jgi:septal ring factor EnvC (AmiA/AmiB activator)